MSVTNVNDENRMTELEGMTNVRMINIVTRLHSSFGFRHFRFEVELRETEIIHYPVLAWPVLRGSHPHLLGLEV
jgi:hypothetical protein